MGNIINTRPPETSVITLPPLRCPLSDATNQLGHQDGDEECLPFELRFIDCNEAYGTGMAKEKCKYYYQDYVECTRKWKQMCRVSDMMAQHEHKWFQGAFGNGPKAPRYYETPRYDGYVPYFLYDDVHWR